ncbi:MAG: hypothetical protein JST93_10700 [Acidobacteria bacterium]|nr:hypothetical protein [Acidobacteriota bacterium]
MRRLILGLAITLSTQAADWSPQRAAQYLDARQQAWFTWQPAIASGRGPCLSCHTGMTYLLARPALRQALHETGPSPQETTHLEAIRKRVPLDTAAKYAPKAKNPHDADQPLGAEAILSTLFLAQQPDAAPAFNRLWSLQIREGEHKGAWHWNVLDLEPWEEPHSVFYGATLAAIAVGLAPAQQKRPEVQALVQYLTSNQSKQPLQNRLMLAWASTKLPGLLTKSQRKAILKEAIEHQQPDGSWTLAALGPWHPHDKAPQQPGPNAYATGLATFLLQKSEPKHPALEKARTWLKAHQHPEGYWDAASLNKPYPEGSMQSQFMRDAATAFAVLALTASSRP